MTGATLELVDVLELLDYDATEHYQLCTQLPGAPFLTAVHPAFASDELTAPQDRDVWFGVNPTAGPARVNSGRGGANDVTRLAAIWVDLDVKPAGCASFDVAQSIIDDLSGILGSTPAFVTMSGHGLQPVWAMDGAYIEDDAAFQRSAAAALLRRWGRLVATVADRRGARVDSLYDLPRVLRCPGSVNHKQPDRPVPVVTTAAGGAPLDVDQLADILTEYGVPQMSEDATDSGVVLAPPAEWRLGDRTCNYARTIITGWSTDSPGARHPWLVAQATRLAAMHRNGCLTPATHRDAERTLTDRFLALVGGNGDRGTTAGEIRGALTFGVERASAMTDDHLARELGSHLHVDEPGERPPVNVSTKAPRHLQSVAAAPPVPPVALAGHDQQAARRQAPPPPPPPPTVGTDPATATVGGGSNLATITDITPTPAVLLELTTLTDRGNADLLAARHADHLRYVPASRLWLEWDGRRWQPAADDGPAIAAAIETVDSLEPRDEPQRKHKQSSMSARALQAAVGLAAKHPAMRVSDDELDADPYALNTPTGTVDLRDGTVRPCDPAELHTLTTAAGYQPGCPSPLWDAFIAQTLPEPELAAYVQRLAGYSTIGTVTEHVLPFLHGAGANGKSVLLNVITTVLGGYASSTPPSFLLEGGREDESAIARLRGLRLVVASEPSPSASFDEGKMKLLTGGDLITARHLFGRHFTFTPSHTLWLSGNHQPRVGAGGESFWRRLRLVPFEHTVPVQQRNAKLTQQILDSESAGVLRWIIDGAIDAHHNGLRDPAAVLDATRGYADEEDHLARFAGDCLVVGGGDLVRIDTRGMRAAYEDWCSSEGERPTDPRTFARELRNRWGVTVKPSNGKRWFTSVTLVVTRGQNDHQPHPARAVRTVADALTL